MASSIVRWISDKKFIGTDSTNHSVVISTPAECIGMKASDLMLVALSSCTAVDVVEILNKKRTKLTKLEIQTTGEQDDDPPWTFRKRAARVCQTNPSPRPLSYPLINTAPWQPP